jgi:hypothetical protein
MILCPIYNGLFQKEILQQEANKTLGIPWFFCLFVVSYKIKSLTLLMSFYV